MTAALIAIAVLAVSLIVLMLHDPRAPGSWWWTALTCVAMVTAFILALRYGLSHSRGYK